MLVWTDDIDDVGPQEHDVLGFYNGLWLMPSKLGGVCHWAHAAEIPVVEETLLTNRELSRWLAQGNGEITKHGWGASYVTHVYDKAHGDEPAPRGLLIRKWDDTNWHKPTHEYAFGEDA